MTPWRGLTLLLAGAALVVAACHDAHDTMRVVPVSAPDPQRPTVLALGNLRCGRAPTAGEAQLAEFLFGVTPDAPTLAAKPVGIAGQGEALLIADIARQAVLRWNAASASLSGAKLRPAPANPIAIATAPDGGVLVADAVGAVLRYDAAGALLRRYEVPDVKFRPADVAVVGRALWATNSAAHRIEVFDLDGGAWTRAIGARGSDAGEFGIPLGLASDGGREVYVVDMLNARVQVLDAEGRWLRHVGGPGTRIGTFGRPKDVALTPDGFVLVTDAASQRVHAFDRDGTPLLAFGAPADDSAIGLCLPNSVAIVPAAVPAARRADERFSASCFVLVTEQMRDPGVRVFAWRSPDAGRLAAARGPVGSAHERPHPAPQVADPHWKADACGACHVEAPAAGRPAIENVDRLCFSCHDGRKAVSEPHPIGVPAVTADATTPASFPTQDGRLSCLTCHEITRHCTPQPVRPATNAGMLRGFEPSHPMEFCTNCHVEDPASALNPHQRSEPVACAICHVPSAALPRDGLRRWNPQLRDATSRTCLRCHTEHWDYAPGGHLGKSLSPDMLARLGALSGGTAGPGRDEIPLEGGKVACFSCHNPHAAGLFPANSPVGAAAAGPRDAELLLRAEQVDLCTACHLP